MQRQSDKTHTNGRRNFLKQSSLATVGTLLGAATMNVPFVHAAENNTINVALVGCGGRGGGALANALQTEGPKKLVAMADVFPAKMTALLRGVSEQFGDSVDVTPDRQFSGFDGYRKAIDAVGPGGVILLATPPAFRPIQLEYAVEKGVHIFAEKSFGVDPPGVRRALKAGEAAKAKNLKIVGGLMTRHKRSVQEAIKQIHDGIIGDVMTCWAYRIQSVDMMPLNPRRENESYLSQQLRQFNNFTWLFGSPLVDWLIHNLDVCCWAKGAYPVVAQGQCARQIRKHKDQIFDQCSVEYAFPDGTRFHAQGRYIPGTWDCFQSTIHGTTGCAILGEGIPQPKIFRGHNPDQKSVIWEGKPGSSEYQVEHDVLFDVIRNDKPHNEVERCAMSTMVGILGRLAAESGQQITWETAFNSDKSLANVESLTSLDDPSPVLPDENDEYPFPIPGQTQVV